MSDHPRAVHLQGVPGWWDEDAAYETQGSDNFTISQQVYHQNLVIEVQVTLVDEGRDRDEQRPIAQELAGTLVEEAAGQVQRPDG